ncbi:MAG: sugar phosphate isomerase/epimerase family protein [Candidatus Heritagella sp.]
MDMLNRIRFSGFSDEISPVFSEQLRVLQKLGIGYLEIRGVDGKNVDSLMPEEVRSAREKLKEAGIQVSAIGSPIGKIGIGDDFAAHFEVFRRVVETAHILSCRDIRMFSFYMPKGEDPLNYRSEVLERLLRLKEYAKKENVRLLHENEKGIYGDTAPRCLDLMNELYDENFGCTFDFANFVQCGQDTQTAFSLLAPFIRYVHVKDALFENGQVVLPGTGDGALLPLFRALDKKGYDGFFSMEPHLTDFAGFAALEQGETEKKASSAQGETAFTAAYLCARGLMSL